MSYQILLAEDDSQIREVIEDYFTEKSNGNFHLQIARTGEEALDAVCEKEFDLCLLDIMLPGASGFEICRAIRQNSIVPIIFITARGGEDDILYGYRLGCDDYIVKPFSLATLYAKVLALLKRSKGLVVSAELTCGNIVLNPAQFTVTVKGEDIDLPPKQFALLKYLMEHKGLVVERDTLLTRIWGYDYEGNERVVDNHIKKLRKALKDSGRQIKTIITKGYKIEE